MLRGVVTAAAAVAALALVPANVGAARPDPSACTLNPEPQATFNVGDLNTYFVTTTGCFTSDKPVRFKLVDGALPPGMRLFTQGVSSGGITGQPTTEGVYTFTLQVRDTTGTSDTESYQITIEPPRPLTISNIIDELSPGTVGEFYCCGNLFPDGGVPDYTWALVSGLLPPGLTLDEDLGRISGTPTASGTFTFTVRVTDARDAIAERTLTITVA